MYSESGEHVRPVPHASPCRTCTAMTGGLPSARAVARPDEVARSARAASSSALGRISQRARCEGEGAAKPPVVARGAWRSPKAAPWAWETRGARRGVCHEGARGSKGARAC
eukprot:952928-Prymnesium_polylepis.1